MPPGVRSVPKCPQSLKVSPLAQNPLSVWSPSILRSLWCRGDPGSARIRGICACMWMGVLLHLQGADEVRDYSGIWWGHHESPGITDLRCYYFQYIESAPKTGCVKSFTKRCLVWTKRVSVKENTLLSEYLHKKHLSGHIKCQRKHSTEWVFAFKTSVKATDFSNGRNYCMLSRGHFYCLGLVNTSTFCCLKSKYSIIITRK